ncbi:CvpA family protein [Stenotrophomonas sp.]|uniref:CvpA family protein n=1 Tax=Stenotrophomonas sp. TaxID=69392 RepID=UPI002D2F0E65|nr:CvpA family protein [Stenotrophomonas sp.]HYQ24719.1 CvpA family protein [Stenotrophomonas sp.]
MIDLVLLIVIAVSTLLGLLRGFVSIVIGTVSWLVAAWAAFAFGNDAARWWAAPAAPGGEHFVGGYLSVGIGVMVVVAVFGMVIKHIVQRNMLGSLDRLLGGMLGAVRGGLIAAILVLLASFTPLSSERSWHASNVRPVLNPAVAWMNSKLPHWQVPGADLLPKGLPKDTLSPSALMELSRSASAELGKAGAGLGKPGATGDNGILNQVVAGSGWLRPAEAEQGDNHDPAKVGPDASALPDNIEPVDPANVDRRRGDH